MTFTNSNLESFTPESQGRDKNDRDNKSRELVVASLINLPNNKLELLRKQIRDQDLFDAVFDSLSIALHQISKSLIPKTNKINFRAEMKAGRANNYDFDLVIESVSGEVTLAVELKKGKSIYDQPQFLSIYVNRAGVITDKLPNYAEFFFDSYFDKIQEYSSCHKIDKASYLKEVFGTKYDTPPFSELYDLGKKSEKAKSWLRNLQYISVNRYIGYVIKSSSSAFNWTDFQERLYLQLPKYFLSWDPILRKFGWEKFNKKSLTLTGEMKTKSKASGLLTSLVLPTKSGQKIEMLLRWKNNACVKGPAWQIKLSAP